MRVIQVQKFGAPDVLQAVDVSAPRPESGQVLVQVEAAGVAFGDTLMRAGKYPRPLPFVPGWEIGGHIIETGEGVDNSLIGQHVVARVMSGGYVEQVVVNLDDIVRVPTGLTVEQAVGVFLSGQTAAAVLNTVHVQPGDRVLIHAAAGSIGSLLVQMVKNAGGRVIGAAGSVDKLVLITRLGAEAAVDYTEAAWTEQVMRATDNRGVDIVLDSVGGDIGQQALNVLAKGRGRLALYGTSSGSGFMMSSQDIALRGLTVLGSIGISMAQPEQMRAYADFVLAEAAAGRLAAQIGQTYPLERASDAHSALESRATTGKILLIP